MVKYVVPEFLVSSDFFTRTEDVSLLGTFKDLQISSKKKVSRVSREFREIIEFSKQNKSLQAMELWKNFDLVSRVFKTFFLLCATLELETRRK